MPNSPGWSLRVFILMVMVIPSVSMVAQDAIATSDTAKPVVSPIPVSEITEEVNNFNQRLAETEQVLKVSDKVMAIDSVFDIEKEYFDKTRAEFYEMEEIGMSRRSYELSKREWQNYLSNLTSQRNVINLRIKELQSTFDNLSLALEKWTLTRENAVQNVVSEELISTAEVTINSINNYKNQIRERLDKVVIIYKEITSEISEIDKLINKITEAQNEIQKKIFQKDSPVLWRAFTEGNSLSNLKDKIIPSILNNYRIISVYLSSNVTTLYYQILLLVLLIIFFVYLKKKSGPLSVNNRNIPEVKSALIIVSPVNTAIILGLIVSVFFYSNRPITLTEFIVLIMLIPVTLIIPRLTGGTVKRGYYVALILFIISTLHAYVFVFAIESRMVLLIETALLLYILIGFRRHRNQLKLQEKGFWVRSITFVNNIFILLLAISILTNITGHLRLSSDLFDAVITSSIFGVITYILTITLTSLIGVLTREKNDQPFRLISKYQSFLNHRLRPFIEMVGLIFWIYVALVSFSVYDIFIDWINGLMDKTWKLGIVDISIGQITSFSIVIIITVLVARAIKVVFQDEWLKRTKIPRGVPEAISMTARYVIIAFGIYLALSAAYVDLGEFGLLAGALGVGIGFGLQNIVYNFIAGLVLSYERPIHVGDTIEVNQLMGNVTEIGVRSSKIKTFDGSEVIVPNGNLISNQVINWTLSDQMRRLMIPVRTSLNADPEKVLKMLKTLAAEHQNTLKNPEPLPLFNGYGDSSLDFTLYFWVHFNVGLGTKSDVALKIYDWLKSENLHIPIPVRRIYYENPPQNTKSDPTVEKDKS